VAQEAAAEALGSLVDAKLSETEVSALQVIEAAEQALLTKAAATPLEQRTEAEQRAWKRAETRRNQQVLRSNALCSRCGNLIGLCRCPKAG
jgi:hypothetical protein